MKHKKAVAEKDTMTKQPVLDRLAAQLAALATLTFTVDNTTDRKRDMLEAIRKSCSGFGNLSDHVQDSWAAVKALQEQAPSKLSSKNFANKEDYVTALTDFNTQAVTVIESLKEAVEALPDDIGANDTKGESTGTRTKFILNAVNIDDNSEVQLTTGEIVKLFKDSKAFANMESSKGMAEALKKFFHEEARLTWTEDETGGAKIFFKIYRQIRPTVCRALDDRNKPKAEAAN